MNAPDAAPNFDRVAVIYRGLEFLAFGSALERARFERLGALAACRHVLALGDGDGRCTARLLALNPGVEVHYLDASPAMLGLAARRIPAAHAGRVTFTRANALTHQFGRSLYDGVLTPFLLDCFTDAEVRLLVTRVTTALTPDARWLFTDFVLPDGGWRRWRGRLWLGGLYAFFRWQCGLRVRSLPESEHHIERAGFAVERSQTYQHGLLRTTLYRRLSRNQSG